MSLIDSMSGLEAHQAAVLRKFKLWPWVKTRVKNVLQEFVMNWHEEYWNLLYGCDSFSGVIQETSSCSVIETRARGWDNCNGGKPVHSGFEAK